VPQNHPILGLWVKKQRSNRTDMSQDRINKLDSIGFVWEVDRNEKNAQF
jgi:hypothetical protein